MTRPKLDKTISTNDFRDNYWLKKELIDFCRETGIKRTGGKIEIADRILKYLETGVVITKPDKERKQTQSNFDWNNETLDSNTPITDNYKNTQNVREFFKHSIESNFKFNVEFMNWMKSSAGKTLGDAIEKWKVIAEKKKGPNYKTEIAPQFEYNAFIRDFLNDNPQLSIKDAIESWKIKREMPGKKKYEKGDFVGYEEGEE